MKKLSLIIALSFLVSCGKAPSDIWPDQNQDKTVYKTEPATAEAYSYELLSRSCETGSTGKHSFASFEQACDGLVDDALNKECALDEREELFVNSQCPGVFTSV